jgi:Protein of unknown function (DUF1706)
MAGRAATKDEVIAAIARERDAWEALLAEVGEDRMLEPGPMGAWTFKDLVAHLPGWRSRSLDRLEAAARGEPEPPPPWPAELETDDEINDWIQAANRDRPLADVLRDSRASFARLAEAVRALPDHDLDDPRRFPGLEGQALGPAVLSGDFFAHLHEEHEPSIRAWLDARR